ncbi:MAG TPA: GNAT family N-acetyltransferase [Aggregatilineaceae bacterium]|nr:GNAT family N-acetyltransferase [Aggregatilineaceae bacterium]
MTIQLREVIDADLPIFYAHQNDPDANRMAAFPARDWESFMAHWARIRADERIILRTVLFEGEVVGNVVSFEQSGQREVGYWIGREWWGRGIATQALTAFLDVVGTRPLLAYVVKHNSGSIRVLEKCGFVRVGEDGEELILKLS